MADSGEYHSKQPQFGRVPAELIHNPEVKDGTIRLYAHMQWRYGKNKSNYEGYTSIAKFLGVSKTTITKRVRELAYFDWLVIVDQDYDTRTGNYRTPYYHLFECQEDCRQFRKDYKPQEGELIRPKPAEDDFEKRKSRKGIGGNPGNLPNASQNVHPSNLSSTGPSNLSSTGPSNLSWTKPVESYPVHSYPVKDSVPAGTQHFSDTTMSISERRLLYRAFQDDWWRGVGGWILYKSVPEYPHWDYKEHVTRAWGKDVKGMAGWIVGQVLGTAKRGEWADWKFEEPARPEELHAFIYWWRSSNPGMSNPLKPETIRVRFDQFRGVRDYANLCAFYKGWLRDEARKEWQAEHQPPTPPTPPEEPVNRKAEMDVIMQGLRERLLA